MCIILKTLNGGDLKQHNHDAFEYIAAGDIFQANLSHPLKLTVFKDWRDL